MSIDIKNKKKLFFIRHGESYGNIGQPVIDSPLTTTGIQQAKLLSGHFDCVIISPLKRAQETLEYSRITYDHLIINPNFRERIIGLTDKLNENETIETDEQFFSRVNQFHQQLESLCEKYDSIVLIGHAYFFNTWYRRGCYPSPGHGQIIEL